MPECTRRALIGGAAVAVLSARVRAARAQDARFFRIATGPTDSAYLAGGTLIGTVVSAPPGSRDCDRGGSCGVPGLIAVAQTTGGSLANLTLLTRRQIDSGFVQADVAFLAGTGALSSANGGAELRAVAALFVETVHAVVRREAAIAGWNDLRGRSVAVGERDSAAAATALALLQAAGLTEADLAIRFLKPADAAAAMRAGGLDALIDVAVQPSPLVAALAQAIDVDLLPIAEAHMQRVNRSVPCFDATAIAAGRYRDVAETVSIARPLLWMVGREAEDKTIYELTRALWHPSNRRILDQNPLGRLMRPESALDGVCVELHPGAAQYYREAGLLKA